MSADSSYSRVISAIGRTEFGPAAMSAYAYHAGADMCSAFALKGGRPMLLVAESRDPSFSPFALIASLRYADRHWKRDREMLYNLGRAHRKVLTARRSARSISDTEYRLECYDGGEVGERLSICHTGSVSIVFNAYRFKATGSFLPDQTDWVEHSAELMIAAATRHYEFVVEHHIAGQTSISNLANLLHSADRGVSLREAQVLAHAASGSTREETARELGVAESSIATYRRRGYSKLGVRSKSQLKEVIQRWSAREENLLSG